MFLGGGAFEYAADFCEFVVLGYQLHFGLHHSALQAESAAVEPHLSEKNRQQCPLLPRLSQK